MIGVLMTRDALIISLIRGTPRVICMPFSQGIQPHILSHGIHAQPWDGIHAQQWDTGRVIA